MQDTISQPAVDDPSPAELVRTTLCPLCWAAPGRCCAIGPLPGNHLSRWVEAVKTGLLSKADLADVIGNLDRDRRPRHDHGAEAGGMNAEIAVRMDSARAVLAGYRRSAPTADVRDRALWAGQLADILGIPAARSGAAGPRPNGSQPASWVAPDGSCVLTRTDMLTVLGALSEVQDWTTSANRVRYRALQYRLGLDR